jgi:hypothetical protein
MRADDVRRLGRTDPFGLEDDLDVAHAAPFDLVDLRPCFEAKLFNRALDVARRSFEFGVVGEVVRTAGDRTHVRLQASGEREFTCRKGRWRPARRLARKDDAVPEGRRRERRANRNDEKTVAKHGAFT